MSTLLIAIRALLLMISFAGLCIGTSKILKIRLCIAPSVAAGGIIVLLMLAGMLRALEPMFWALYIAGFAAVINLFLTPPEDFSI